MAVLALTGNKPGGGTPTFTWLLHTSGADMATGLVVADGDGNASALWIADDAIGVVSDTSAVTLFVSDATTTRTIRFPDHSGRLYPEEIRATVADATNTTVTASAVAQLEIQPAQAGWYEFELVAIFQSAALTTGVTLTLTAPPEAGAASWRSTIATTNATTTAFNSSASMPATIATTASPAVGTDFIGIIRGMIRFATPPSGPFTVGFASEVATSQVTLRAGTVFRVKRIGAP